MLVLRMATLAMALVASGPRGQGPGARQFGASLFEKTGGLFSLWQCGVSAWIFLTYGVLVNASLGETWEAREAERGAWMNADDTDQAQLEPQAPC
jgi:hypothetical protein